MNLPFRRNKDVSAVPAEIQEYYQSERRERTGVAWLLALGTLIITVGLATLLFFGGRWAYRAIANNDDNQQTAQTTENTEDKDSENADNPETAPSTDPGQADTSTGTSSTSTSTPNSPNNTDTATGTTPRTPNPSPNGAVAGNSTDLPNTGAGNIAAVFAVTTAIGTTAHYAFTSRRNQE